MTTEDVSSQFKLLGKMVMHVKVTRGRTLGRQLSCRANRIEALLELGQSHQAKLESV
jgi:hypothetical protein